MAAQKVEKPQAAEKAKEVFDIERSHLEKLKKEFMEKPGKAEKVAALKAYLKPLVEKKYLLAPADAQGKFLLKSPPEVDAAKKAAVEKTFSLVNTQLREMQDYASGSVKIQKHEGGKSDAYDVADVFQDALSDMLVDSAMVGKITPKETSVSSPEDLLKLAKQNKLGSLGALLNATENLSGEDLKQRDKAIADITKALQGNQEATAALRTESTAHAEDVRTRTEEVAKHFDKNAWEKFTEGGQFLTGNIASKGLLGLVDSVPKIMNIFPILFSLLIPSKGLRYTALALTGAQFLYGNTTMNRSLLKDTAGVANSWFGGKPATSTVGAPGDKYGAPALGVASEKKNTVSLNAEEQRWINVLNGKLPDADLLVLKELFDARAEKVLAEVSLDRKNPNSSLDQWDISLKKVDGLFSGEARARLQEQNSSFKAEDISGALYRFFERVGETWKSDIITSRDIPNGNAFASERTPAYLGWLAVGKVFSKQTQGDVNALAKNYLHPGATFSEVSALMLDRSPIKNTNEPYDNARKEVARVIAGHETWATDAQRKEGTSKGAAQPNKAANAPSVNAERPGPTTAPAPAFERTPENINRADRIEAIEAKGYYTREDILGIIKLQDKTGLFQGRIEQMMETQINNSVILLAQGHIGQVEENLKSLLGNFKNTKIDAAGTKMDPEQTLRTLYLRFYKDERLLGHEKRIEELIRRLSPSLAQ